MGKYAFFDFNNNFGGAPKGSIALAASLNRSGVDVIVYDVYGKNDRYKKEIRCQNLKLEVLIGGSKDTFIGGANALVRGYRISKQLPTFARLVKKLRKSFKRENVDLVWVNNHKSLFFVSIAGYGLGIKKVLYHRGWARKEDFPLLYRLNVNLNCNAVVTHSRAAANNLSSYFKAKHVIEVPNGVRLAKEYSRPKRDDSEYRVCLPAARPVIEKGHQVAVDALKILSSKGYDNIVLLFPGEPPVGHSVDFVVNLQSRIKKYGLQDKVRFVGWIDDMPGFLSSCDLVILPSHSEGFPRVVIESMLVGTPVITTPVGGLPEAITHGSTGYLVGVDNADGFARCIEELYLEPQQAKKIALNAQATASRKFTVERQVSIMLRVFKAITRRN